MASDSFIHKIVIYTTNYIDIQFIHYIQDDQFSIATGETTKKERGWRLLKCCDRRCDLCDCDHDSRYFKRLSFGSGWAESWIWVRSLLFPKLNILCDWNSWTTNIVLSYLETAGDCLLLLITAHTSRLCYRRCGFFCFVYAIFLGYFHILKGEKPNATLLNKQHHIHELYDSQQ